MDQFSSELEEPKTPDHYGDLELLPTATAAEIKRAHNRLAKKHHPDKQAPGTIADAHEFRKIREAYETLRDASKRLEYDKIYPQVKLSWAHYRTKEKEWREYEEARRFEEECRRRREAEAAKVRKMEEQRWAAAVEAERRRKEAEAREARRKAEEERLAMEKEERERIRREKEKLAEERSREAARRAREQQERNAQARLRTQKEEEAERRSEEVARKARLEKEKAALERLRTQKMEENLVSARQNWARMRELAEGRRSQKPQKPQSETRPAQLQPQAQRPTDCRHPRIGWPRKKGRAKCIFCGDSLAKYSFRCPECGVAACQPCKNSYCVF